MEDLIKRIKVSCGYKTDAAIAKALGMSPQNFLSQKKSGGIKDSLILLGIDKGISKGWLLTGQGEMKATTTPDNNKTSSRHDHQLDTLNALLDATVARLDEQSKRLDLLAEVYKHAQQGMLDMWSVINQVQAHIAKMNETLDDINRRLSAAANADNLRFLGKTGEAAE